MRAHAQREPCQLCVEECKAAGYDAIEFRRVGTQVDALGMPVEGSGFLAPVVLSDKCVGCGLCETRCYRINVTHKHLLANTAVRIAAGMGKDDRLFPGSYRNLREAERQLESSATPASTNDEKYCPISLSECSS